jgi:hypothetical protein
MFLHSSQNQFSAFHCSQLLLTLLLRQFFQIGLVAVSAGGGFIYLEMF